jgi:hypothetical protein
MIPQDAAEIITLNQRMVNWTRWARNQGSGLAHCNSIEYRYHTPQCWWPEQPREDVDLQDAAKVEVCIRDMVLPYQKPLVLHWVVHWGKRDPVTGSVPVDVVSDLWRRLSRDYKFVINRTQVVERIDRAQLTVARRLTALI